MQTRQARCSRRRLLLSTLASPFVVGFSTLACSNNPAPSPTAAPAGGAVASPPAVASPAAVARAPRGSVPDTKVNPLGVNSFLDREVEEWKKERTFQMMQEAGIGWLKQYFSWEEIESAKGTFKWDKFDQIVNYADKYGIKVIARADRPPEWARKPGNPPEGPPAKFEDYGDFVFALLKRYAGKVDHIQAWNEPNIFPEWGNQDVNPAQYVDLLKIAYRRAKEANPNVKVLSAPLAINVEKGGQNMNEIDYLDGMYKAGAKDFFDIASANAYGLEYPPEDAPDPQKLNFRRVELLRAVMERNGDATKAVWFNEFGWNASPESMPAEKLIWRRVTPAQQATYTVNGYKYAAQNYPWAGVICMWYFRQVGDIPETQSDAFFRLVNPDFSPTPAYLSIKDNAAQIKQLWQP